ncbi:FKBP-type peptidyl-prolyl cis-trans isomerase, partial [Acinetobacter baumannii]|uniref:FKBP-type peptidyl-prolyl cis-trans isomerase n=1 Tax=Acinetobacter baumannii TaxID=470 RepID=UPI001D17472D
TEGLQLMKEGGKATFFIPSNLAYGPQELPGIPANGVDLREPRKPCPPEVAQANALP